MTVSALNPDLNDIEGYVYLRRRFFSKRRPLYLRLNGSVLTAHQSPKAPIDWHVSLLDASVHLYHRRASLVVTLSSSSKLYIQPRHRDTSQKWFHAFNHASQRRFEAFYKLGKKIGEGAFASVHKAIRLHDKATVAVKLIKKKQFDMQMARELHREMYAMKTITHPALISAYDVFHTPDRVLIVMDYMKGSTLKDNIQANGSKISEKHAIPIMRQIIQACHYLHSNGFVHRDLKLENVLCHRRGISNARVRIADFGYVNFVDHAQQQCLRSLVGTPVYVAPEIINRQSYGAPVDMYAIGVMLHRMLLGYYPYEAEDDDKSLALALQANLRVDGKAWRTISPLCKSFIQALLNPDPQERITASDALNHPWFQLTHLNSIPEPSSMSVTLTGTESPVMMSPVTPDVSLAVKTNHGQSGLKSWQMKTSSKGSDTKTGDVHPSTCDAKS